MLISVATEGGCGQGTHGRPVATALSVQHTSVVCSPGHGGCSDVSSVTLGSHNLDLVMLQGLEFAVPGLHVTQVRPFTVERKYTFLHARSD